MNYTRPMPDARKVRQDMTAAEIRSAIAEISEAMTGPLSNLDRSLYHHDRADLRARLAELEA